MQGEHNLDLSLWLLVLEGEKKRKKGKERKRTERCGTDFLVHMTFQKWDSMT